MAITTRQHRVEYKSTNSQAWQIKDLTTPSYFLLNQFLQKAAVSLKALMTALNPTTSHPCPPLNQFSGYGGALEVGDLGSNPGSTDTWRWDVEQVVLAGEPLNLICRMG